MKSGASFRLAAAAVCGMFFCITSAQGGFLLNLYRASEKAAAAQQQKCIDQGWSPEQPWSTARRQVEDVEHAVRKHGIGSVKQYVSRLELELSCAETTFKLALKPDADKRIVVLVDYVFTDDMVPGVGVSKDSDDAPYTAKGSELSLANVRAAKAYITETGADWAFVTRNPYPAMALYLAKYYNKNHQAEDALRVASLDFTFPKIEASPNRTSALEREAAKAKAAGAGKADAPVFGPS